jgi:hypothetical protein
MLDSKQNVTLKPTIVYLLLLLWFSMYKENTRLNLRNYLRTMGAKSIVANFSELLR